MATQITVSAKYFAARRAVERLDVRMGQQVGLQVAPLVEGPTARRTLMGRIV